MWEEKPALKDILFETSPVELDERYQTQLPLHNFKKYAFAESNQANLIESTAGDKMDKIHYGKYIPPAEATDGIGKAGRRSMHQAV